jgi:flagellar biosynthesis GTPase FlhF
LIREIGIAIADQNSSQLTRFQRYYFKLTHHRNLVKLGPLRFLCYNTGAKSEGKRKIPRRLVMNGKSIIAGIVLCTAAIAAAQAPPPMTLPADVANIKQSIQSLPWREIDLTTVSPLEMDRALLLMNHVLNEIAPVRASEADLMSGYIEAQNLGAEFAKAPKPPAGKELTYTDATKIAVAMLRGPMANSTYASQFGGASTEELAAYRELYDATCQRRWSEITESREQSRWMGAFLQSQGKLQDYQAWAKVESENRELAYQLQLEKNAAAADAAAQAAQARAVAEQEEQEKLQLQQALAAAQAQQQEAFAAGQQQQQMDQQQPPPPQEDAPYYTGYGTPGYYGSGAAWCYDCTYGNEARTRTERRMSDFYGTPHTGGGGGGFHGGGGGGHR